MSILPSCQSTCGMESNQAASLDASSVVFRGGHVARGVCAPCNPRKNACALVSQRVFQAHPAQESAIFCKRDVRVLAANATVRYWWRSSHGLQPCENVCNDAGS